MRVARDLHTISCTPHHSFARAEQEDAGLAHVLTNVIRNAFSRAMKSHTSVLYGNIDPLPGQAKSCSGFSDHEGNGVRAFLRCDTRASLHDCCSASVMLDSQGNCNCVLIWRTSLLSLLRRMPNQVSTQHYLRVNQRLFSRAVPGR